MSILERVMDRIRDATGGAATWPPRELAEHWERVEGYRRRFRNDTDELIQFNPRVNRSEHRKSVYTPVPVARELAMYSAALLFSDPPKISSEDYPDELDRIVEDGALVPLLQHVGELVASEGRAGLRVVWDEEYAEQPFVTWVPEDRCIWEIRHGHLYTGGIAVQEYMPDPDANIIYRLLEEHGKGYVERHLYRGRVHQLGEEVGLDAIPETGELEDYTETGLDAPTLVPWENRPGGHSDIAALDALLERLDEAESIFVDKGRRSVPLTFVDRQLADEQGEVDLEGIHLTGATNLDLPMGEMTQKTVETAQPALQSQETIEWINHLWDMITTHAGYASASWGTGEQGRTDSGSALKLRQARTLLTRAGKERMAREAITKALSIALCWSDGGSRIVDYRPEVQLGDGLPEDSMERAQELATRRSAEIVSLRQAIREQHPHWSQEEVDEEEERIKSEEPEAPQVTTGNLRLDDEGVSDGQAQGPRPDPGT